MTHPATVTGLVTEPPGTVDPAVPATLPAPAPSASPTARAAPAVPKLARNTGSDGKGTDRDSGNSRGGRGGRGEKSGRGGHWIPLLGEKIRIKKHNQAGVTDTKGPGAATKGAPETHPATVPGLVTESSGKRNDPVVPASLSAPAP